MYNVLVSALMLMLNLFSFINPMLTEKQFQQGCVTFAIVLKVTAETPGRAVSFLKTSQSPCNCQAGVLCLARLKVTRV